MSARPAETTQVHTRLLKCALQVEEARAYWQHTDGSTVVAPGDAFASYWFGARSLAWVEVLLTNLRARFDAFPAALPVLHRWPDMTPDTRRVLCHWHLQLSDPMYRTFTGDYLVQRREGTRATVSRDLVVGWVAEQGPGRWRMSTRIQFASKLLSAALSAGLVSSSRDPRPLSLPRVDDEALQYLLYLLREIEFAGTLLDNPYTRSVGLVEGRMEERLRNLHGLSFRRQGDLVEFGWQYPNLGAWADANLPARPALDSGGLR